MPQIVITRDAACELIGKLENLFKCEENSDFPIHSIKIATGGSPGAETPQADVNIYPELTPYEIR